MNFLPIIKLSLNVVIITFGVNILLLRMVGAIYRLLPLVAAYKGSFDTVIIDDSLKLKGSSRTSLILE